MIINATIIFIIVFAVAIIAMNDIFIVICIVFFSILNIHSFTMRPYKFTKMVTMGIT